MPKLVLRVAVGEKSYPDRPRSGTYFGLAPWCKEQGITDFGFVERIEVTEFDDGSLVAYFTRRETLTDAEHEALKAEKGSSSPSKIRVYPDEDPITHTFIEHHPVTSVQLLLDQFEEPEGETLVFTSGERAERDS